MKKLKVQLRSLLDYVKIVLLINFEKQISIIFVKKAKKNYLAFYILNILNEQNSKRTQKRNFLILRKNTL